jgi:putative transposase
MQRQKKRHSRAEIVAKLDEAAGMAAQGQTQTEIARSLGISVMTFHRWRKAIPPRPPVPDDTTPSPDSKASSGLSLERERGTRIAELQLENTRLRKLVTDLLLEKMRLEDETRQPAVKALRA